MTIGLYKPRAAEYLPYDSEAPRVAALIVEKIVSAGNELTVEHIGSTAVPGCWGKGIIDLVVMYREGQLQIARDTLDGLGFQPQCGPEPFPESRPMRVGSIDYLGRPYQLHAHVVAVESREARDLIRFRDLLRCNDSLLRAYEMEKRAILARGITLSTDYSKAKGAFIHRVLAADKF
ncbi:MAG TPA: GrpB family protein [Acidobacteriota bacterium]|nr:GrpB family protein [Acidobacteriota bacterium]